ncbi:MAG TPA: GFA family protein [Devosiaceae bacterium]|jgi:hypothetical protein
MKVSGTCHCGATHFTVEAAPVEVTECSCTYCAKSGGLWAYYEPGQFTLVSAEGERVYSKTGYNKHHFCAVCGCSTFGVSPVWSLEGEPDFTKERLAINARLLDDFDLATVKINKIDGRNLW